ncbi:hypothetical protein X975_15133, partial [Stegodyphus mimosarum]
MALTFSLANLSSSFSLARFFAHSLISMSRFACSACCMAFPILLLSNSSLFSFSFSSISLLCFCASNNALALSTFSCNVNLDSASSAISEEDGPSKTLSLLEDEGAGDSEDDGTATLLFFLTALFSNTSSTLSILEEKSAGSKLPVITSIGAPFTPMK